MMSSRKSSGTKMPPWESVPDASAFFCTCEKAVSSSVESALS